MNEMMIKIDNVSKQYKLGQIGGTTIREELQRKRAKLLHQEDPTKKIGAKDYNKGETFLALDGVSFEVQKGERVGIIGHNGAGKSTLLKLLSRVTAPTSGMIGLNGRVASMLEVGTGFHAELTGRENIYMNGAILGMTRKEIDAKIEDIIEFSECRQFIDTPVKRYSSGMYVKLAFSVAAHLDSEIMIMDEVLAVGDMAFQKKCLNKMNDVSKTQGRTILYVSHNMNTIRQLCERVIVLDHGKVVFDGEVETGIELYMNNSPLNLKIDNDLSDKRAEHLSEKIDAKIMRIVILDKKESIFKYNESIQFKITINYYRKVINPCLRFEIRSDAGVPVGISFLKLCTMIEDIGSTQYIVELFVGGIVPGNYNVNVILFETGDFGKYCDLDAVCPGFQFAISDFDGDVDIVWNYSFWGRMMLPNASMKRKI